MTTMSRNTSVQFNDSKNYRGWACLGAEGRIEKPFTQRRNS